MSALTPFFCREHRRPDAYLLDVVTLQLMCPLCIALNGVDRNAPRYIYTTNQVIPYLCRMRLDPYGSMNRAADYVLRDELRRTGYARTTRMRLLPPLVESSRELARAPAPATDIEMTLLTALAQCGTSTKHRFFRVPEITLITRLIARHASFGFLFTTPVTVMEHLENALKWVLVFSTPDTTRLKRNVVRAMVSVSRLTPKDSEITLLKLVKLLKDTGFALASVPIHPDSSVAEAEAAAAAIAGHRLPTADGGRSVAAVAELLMALLRFRDFNLRTIVELLPHERGGAILEAVRDLATGPQGAAPSTVAVAADAVRLVDQALAESAETRTRTRTHVEKRPRDQFT